MKRSKSLFGIEIYIVESYHSRQSKEATVVSVFTDTIYYIHTDLLGSYNVITDQNKNVVNTLQFDPWGNRRLYNDWRKSDTCTHLFDRGFTGHEHLDIFKIINMNGRLYDPVIARFFSPNPFVQLPDFTQNFNRYSYCLNNPLKYTDPSGEFVITAATAAIISAVVVGEYLGGSSVNGTFNPIKWDYNNWQTYAGIAVGGIAGWAVTGAGIGAGISSVMAGASFGAGFAGTAAAGVSTGFIAGAATGAAAGFSSGFTTGLGNGLIQGNNFGEALWSGTKAGLISGASGFAVGGITGGIDATARGRNFWTGSYKQYKLPLNYLANTNNSLNFDQYSYPDNATVANADKYNVYYKPEDGIYGIEDFVEPGKYITDPVDGVATSKYIDQVFKIPDGGHIKVLIGGDIKFTNGNGLYDVAEFFGIRCGWKSPQYFIDRNSYNDWKSLFNVARLFIR